MTDSAGRDIASHGDLDLIVVGSGIAGLTAAVRAIDRGLRVAVVTKGNIDEAATGWAQGGVAAVLGQIVEDSEAIHVDDTLRAGVDLCDVDAVRVLVHEGPARVRELMNLGAQFDRDPDGTLQLAREGGHSFERVVHAGGAATGAEIERALVAAVRRTALAVHEHVFATGLLDDGASCTGVRVQDRHTGIERDVRARHTLLATGGAGQVFALTTNPMQATGDGLAIALRAGAAVADVEFVQFHPTALAVDRLPRPLLSEALRGHGALLRTQSGERFVDELQPRDVVARAITRQMLESGIDHVWLDVSPVHDFEIRYPSLARASRAEGFDPPTDWLPVAPAAHYLCGGVLTDLDGATSRRGLWAAGEVACSGIHGANRLASNSLLEGLVFGARVVDAIAKGKDGPTDDGALRALGDGPQRGLHLTLPPVDRSLRSAGAGAAAAGVVPSRSDLQQGMTRYVGVLRDAASLSEADRLVSAMRAAVDADTAAAAPELVNLLTVAAATVAAAQTREESRGAHTRLDFPERDDDHFRRRIVFGA
jgi:L-aspartate oxidase